jgi:cyclomaltodextrinase
MHQPGPLEDWETPPTRHGFKGGDLYGITERLGELQELGINALYLCPIFSSASNHRYHTYDYFNVDPMLGGNEALRELLDAAHGRGMRVILDGVFNHASRGFWPFHHVLENGAQSPYVDWFYTDEAFLRGDRPLIAYPESVDWHVKQSADSGTARASDLAASIGYKAWWQLPALPKINVSNPEAREHLLKAAEFWIRFGADGWRLDVPEEIDDESFWQEFRTRVRAINPEAYTVGEIWKRADAWLTGDRFDAVMNYPLTEAILGYVGSGRLARDLGDHNETYKRPELDAAQFAEQLNEIMGWYHPATTAVQLNLLGSHDTPRLRSIVGGSAAAARLAMLLQFSLPGAPCIYYGDELGALGANDPANRGSFPADLTSLSAEAAAFRAFVRGVVAARREHPVLRAGALRVVRAEGPVLTFERSGEPVGFEGRPLPVVPGAASRYLVAANSGESPARVQVRVEGVGTVTRLDWEGATGAASRRENGSLEIDLPPVSGAIFQLT